MSSKELIYIDWNLFSILKKPTLEPHILLNEFLTQNSDKITLVYSDAHLGDLHQTSDSNLRESDLTYLSSRTMDLTMVHYFGRDYVDIETRNPIEFYNSNVYDNSTGLMATFQSLIKLFTNQYGALRDDIIKKQFNLEPKSICNFNVKQLDELVRMIGISDSLKGLIEFGLSLRGDTSRNPLSYVDYYVLGYTNLDLISYFPDSMNESDKFDNLLNDAKHSAYGSMCKAFITNDNKCYHKSKLLFEYFNSDSKLIKTCKLKGDLDHLKNDLLSLIN